MECFLTLSYFSGSPSVAFFNDDPARLWYVRAIDMALSDLSEDPIKRASYFDDFQFEILIDFEPDSEAWETFNPRQARRREFFNTVVANIFSREPGSISKSEEYTREVFTYMLRRRLPYNFVDQVGFKNYGRMRKPSGELKSLVSMVVSFHPFL